MPASSRFQRNIGPNQFLHCRHCRIRNFQLAAFCNDRIAKLLQPASERFTDSWQTHDRPLEPVIGYPELPAVTVPMEHHVHQARSIR